MISYLPLKTIDTPELKFVPITIHLAFLGLSRTNGIWQSDLHILKNGLCFYLTSSSVSEILSQNATSEDFEQASRSLVHKFGALFAPSTGAN